MSSLIPERPLLVSPSLAATIGLEEAAMLSVLSDLAGHRTGENDKGYRWFDLDRRIVESHMPFWTAHDIQRVAKNLNDKGIILLRSAPYASSHCLEFAFNEHAHEPANVAPIKPQAHNAITPGAHRIAPNWQPSDEILKQIRQHGIDMDFALQQLPEFISYWRERDEPHHAWGAKFLRQVLREWRNRETDIYRKDSATAMNDNWQPSEDALEVLIKHASISREFVEDAIPEFVLYWRERGDSSRTWNSKFIQHVRRQWNKYTTTVENDTVPKPIPENWQPGEDVFDVLRLANIDIGFAKNLVQEFVLFWRDCGQVASSWNTKFLQHVKYHWAKRHQSESIAASGGGVSSTTHRTRDRSLVDDLTDRSWAY